MCLHAYPYVWGHMSEIESAKIFFRNAALKCSVENVCSDEALSKENMGM